jgi:hypothetical protein
MKITAKCHKCNSSFSVEDKFIGRKAKCSKCGETFVVQAPAEASEPEKPEEVYAFSSESPAPALGNANIDSLLGGESVRCPVCQKEMAIGAVICVNCGYDMRTGARVQFQKEKDHSKPKGTLKAPGQPAGGKPAGKKSRKKSGQSAKINSIIKVSVVLTVLVASVACVWGAIALYHHILFIADQNDAFIRLDILLDKDEPAANTLAKELPYVYDYFQQLPKRWPRYEKGRSIRFIETLYRLPKQADIAPILKFPSDSVYYHSILELVKQNTDLAWQLEKSCDPNDCVRQYAADALMASLPLITWSDADKKAMLEHTELSEKQHRFNAFAEKSRAAAEQKIAGRYYCRLKISPNAPESKATIGRTPSPVFEAVCKNNVWNVSFFGRVWTGPIEQFSKIHLVCSLWDNRDLFPNSQFTPGIAYPEAHLHFEKDAFAIEVDIPTQNFQSQAKQNWYDRASSLLSYEIALEKAPDQEPMATFPPASDPVKK